MLLLFLLLLVMDGVSGAETDEKMSVMEGDSLTLHTDLTEIQNDDTILWMFGPKDSVISQITRKNDFTSFFVTDETGFRDRLQVDQKTGSLTIRNTRIRHSGQYKLSVSREKTTIKQFSVTVFGAVNETDGVKSVSVMEGKPVTLHTDTEIHTDDLILWRFGDKGILLAKIDVETKETSLNDADERFRDRLKLDQTGSLTIKSTKFEHTGLYEVQIRGRESPRRFLLSVSAVSDLTSGTIAAIVAAVLLVATAVLAAVVIYYRRKITDLQMEKKDPVKEGESTILKTDVTELHDDDVIEWWYEDEDENENNLLAKIDKKNKKKRGPFSGADGRFRSSLVLNEQTGDLKITDIRTIHSGLYKLKINRGKIMKRKTIAVSVTVKKLLANVGEAVPLKNDAIIQKDDLILWTFGAEKCLVVKVDSGKTTFSEKYKDRVDYQNGSLTIKKMETQDFGQYKLQIVNSEQTTTRRFNVTDSTGNTKTSTNTNDESKPLISREDGQEGISSV